MDRRSLGFLMASLLLSCLASSSFGAYTVTTYNMAVARSAPALALLNNKLFIAGGNVFGSSSGTSSLEIFDTVSRTFSSSLQLSTVRDNLLALSFPFSNKILFVDTDTGAVEQYDGSTNTITQLPITLTPPITAGAVNNKAVFVTGPFGQSAQIYNVDTGLLIPYSLCTTMCEDRGQGIAVARVGNKLIFAGGGPSLSTRINVYDDSTGSFTTLNGALSIGRMNLRTAVSGSKVIFAGSSFNPFVGVSSTNAVAESTVDVFDTTTNTVTTYHLPTARSGFNFAAVNNKVLFAGGTTNGGQWTNLVEVLDLSTGTWTSGSLSSVRGEMDAVSLGGNAVFAGGSNTNFDFSSSNIFDIVSPSGSTIASLTGGYHILSSSLVNGNTAYVVGGELYQGRKSESLDVVEVISGDSCTSQSDCVPVSVDYNFAQCVNGKCQCKDTFSGSASSTDKCNCPSGKTLAWEGSNPYCLAAGECLANQSWLCASVTTNYPFVTCQGPNTVKSCQCKGGFVPTSNPTASNQCRCEGTLTWDGNGQPSCN